MTEYAFNAQSRMMHFMPCIHVPQEGGPNWIFFPDQQAAKQWISKYKVNPKPCGYCYTKSRWSEIR